MPVLCRASAEIVPFIARPREPDRLTSMDRIHALQWDMTQAAPARARLAIHDRQPDDAPEVGDYIGIYRAGERWAAWGVARLGAWVTVWHGATGLDLGLFSSMRDALAAVSQASLQPRGMR